MPDPLVVTSLHFGGAADVAGLLAQERGLGYACVSRLVRQSRDVDLKAYRPYGGLDHDPTSPEARTYHQLARDLSGLLLDPLLSGRNRCSALDEPADALHAIRDLRTEGTLDQDPGPLAMLVMSDARLRWTARRRALGRPQDDPLRDPYGDAAEQDFQQLRRLQDELRQAVEQLHDRPTRVIDLIDPTVNYESEANTADADFDSFVQAADHLKEWLTEL